MWASIRSVVRVFSDSVPDSEDRSALLGSRGAKQMPLNSTFERAINSKGGMCCPWVALKEFGELSPGIQAADGGNT